MSRGENILVINDIKQKFEHTGDEGFYEMVPHTQTEGESPV